MSNDVERKEAKALLEYLSRMEGEQQRQALEEVNRITDGPVKQLARLKARAL